MTAPTPTTLTVTIPSPRRRALTSALATVLALGSLVVSPEQAVAAVPEVRVALHAGVDLSGPLAVYGSSVLLGTHRSTDGGATWSTALPGVTWIASDKGRLVGYEYNTAVVYDVATGTLATYGLPGVPASMTSTWSLSMGADGFTAYNFVTQGPAVPLLPPTGVTMMTSGAQLISGDRVLWHGHANGLHEYVAVAASPTAQPGPWVDVNRAIGGMATASQLLYAFPADGYFPTSSVVLCARSLADLAAQPICSTVVTGDIWGLSAPTYDFGTTALVDVVTWSGSRQETSTPLLWDGSHATKVQLPAGQRMDLLGSSGGFALYGDSPYVLVRDSNTVPSIRKVNADGSTSTAFTPPPLSVAPVGSLAVAPDRVVGADGRDGSEVMPLWTRAVSAAGFGAETLLSSRSSAVEASAARTVSSGPSGLSVYDRGSLRNTIADARLSQLSGPFLTREVPNSTTNGHDVEALTVDGTLVARFTGTDGTLFGSEYVSWTRDASTSGKAHVVVTDLSGAASPRTVDLSDGSAACSAGRVWNSTLVMICGTTDVRAFDLRTGSLVASLPHPANEIVVGLLDVGDGYAVVALNGQGYNVWDVAAGTLTNLGTCSRLFTSDGVGHIACVSDTELIWRDFSSLSTSGPRLLGALGSATADFSDAGNRWTVDLDATKPLLAGSLEIRDAHMTLVRSIATPATADGSLRQVTWDGLDDSGVPVPAGVYTFRLVADAADGSGSLTAPDGTLAENGRVVVTSGSPAGKKPGAAMTVMPSRILDTRVTGPKLAPATPRTLQVTGVGGVPSSGVSAVVLNVTVTDTTSGGYLTVSPTGTPRPVVSNLNWAAGDTIPNAVTVKVGTGGQVDLYQSGPGSTNVIVDVSGYYLDGQVLEPGGFTSLTPARILDTRATGGKLASGETRDLPILGRGGVPQDNVSAVVLNVTVTDTDGVGYLTVFPAGTPRPLASNLNWSPGWTIPNLVTVKVGENGAVSLFQSGSGRANVVVDVAGYYLGGTPEKPGMFVAIDPARVMDTREGSPVAGLTGLGLLVMGAGGIPRANVAAVVLNVTVTDTVTAGYLALFPGETFPPSTSNLNWSWPNTTIANLVTVQVGADGRVAIDNGSPGRVQVVVDTAGYFLGA